VSDTRPTPGSDTGRTLRHLTLVAEPPARRLRPTIACMLAAGIDLMS
jgi:hypothetical protein